MLYFAYGSNMLTARLAERVPSAAPVGPGWLSGHRLAFHLRGGDGSGKCNVRRTGVPQDVVHGVLYAVDAHRLDRLHAAEGPPYAFVELEIGTRDGPVHAATYRGRPEYLDDALVPFDWYRDFVIRGAREHGLPAAHVAALEAVVSEPDADTERAAMNQRILAQGTTQAH